MNVALDIFLKFLWLGAVGFGGPLAIVAIMQREFVEKEKWISLDEFQRAFALIKAMPGAVAFSTAVYLGRRRGGFVGGCLAAIGLLAPSFLAITIFASVYSQFSNSELFDSILLGMQAAALALIAAALITLIGPWARSPMFLVLSAMGALVFVFNWIPEPALIVGGGILWVLVRHRPASSNFAAGAFAMSADPEVLLRLFWICFKAGAFVFGTGIAIAPLLERDFVAEMGWVTRAEFLDALAVGQVTPGPVLMTTTFLGHKVAGLPGALTATVSVFLASFFHMMTWFPYVMDRLARQKWIPHFLFGALAMVAGTIAVTVVVLGSDWTDRPMLYVLSALVFIAVLTKRAPSWALIVISGALGPFIL